MAMMPASQPSSVTIDANILIALCAKEVDKYDTADAELTRATLGPGLYFMCRASSWPSACMSCARNVRITLFHPMKHAAAVSDLGTYMGMILPPPQGEQSLIARAEQIRSGYGCSRSSDGLYLALTEELAGAGPAELLTFDSGLESQAKATAPSVVVRLLVPTLPPKSTSAGAPPSSNP